MVQDPDPEPTARRRSVLTAIGSMAAVGGLTSVAGAAPDEGFVLRQGGECVPITPLSGDQPVEALYDYGVHETQYSSAGTVDLQRPDTSILFLYDGPNGLSLVIVHNELGGSGDGGSATFEISGLPADGEWVVQDDRYDGASNYDRWEVDATWSGIDWTWAASRTDGGAFLGLGDATAITIDPAFNQEAELYGEFYDGTVTDWQLLTGDLENPRRVSLALDQSVTIERGPCDAADPSGEVSEDDDDGDHDRGHGNDPDGHDEDNPGRGPPDDNDERGRGPPEDDEPGRGPPEDDDHPGRGPPDDDERGPHAADDDDEDDRDEVASAAADTDVDRDEDDGDDEDDDEEDD